MAYIKDLKKGELVRYRGEVYPFCRYSVRTSIMDKLCRLTVDDNHRLADGYKESILIETSEITRHNHIYLGGE